MRDPVQVLLPPVIHPLAVAPAVDLRLAAALAALVCLAVMVSVAAGLGVARDQVTAALRAVVQLSLIALVVGAVLASFVLASLFVFVMLVVAGITSVRRMGVPLRRAPWVVSALAVGAGPVIAIALASGVLPLNALGLLPYAGIIIGGTMNAATLTGRRAAQELAARRGEYEAALALGLSARDSATLVLRPNAAEALVPGLDQTRTVGLVTLPGAFVGVLLGGGSALEAAAAQVLVLIGLLAAQSVVASATFWLVATRRALRADLVDTLPI